MMSRLLSVIGKGITTEYKKEFYLWLISLFLFVLALFLFFKELKAYFALSYSKKNIERSYFKNQPQIVKLKRVLCKINWKREFKKETFEIKTTIDLRNLRKAYDSLEKLTPLKEDTFFVLKKMEYNLSKDKPPLLQVYGEVITFR